MIREYDFKCIIELDSEHALDMDECEIMAKSIAQEIRQTFEHIESVKNEKIKEI